MWAIKIKRRWRGNPFLKDNIDFYLTTKAVIYLTVPNTEFFSSAWGSRTNTESKGVVDGQQFLASTTWGMNIYFM